MKSSSYGIYGCCIFCLIKTRNNKESTIENGATAIVIEHTLIKQFVNWLKINVEFF